MSRTDPRPEPAPERLRLTCRDVIGLLLEYLEATLNDDTLAQFERHLAECAPCRTYLRTYDRSRRLVGEVSRVEMPAEMRARLRELLLGQLGAGSS